MDNEQSIVAIIGFSTAIVFIVKASTPDNYDYMGPVANRNQRSGGAYMRVAFGGCLVIIVLLVVAKSQPKFAEALAWLVLAGTLFSYAAPLGSFLTKWFEQTPNVVDVLPDGSKRDRGTGVTTRPDGTTSTDPGTSGYVPHDLNPATNPNIVQI